MAFVMQHPAVSYFALVFALSWGGVLVVVGPGGIPGSPEQFEALLPWAILAMVAGPSVAGILLTGLVQGRAGLRAFLTRLLKWRVGPHWYAVALLTAPLLMLVVLLPLSLFSPQFLPGILVSDDKASMLLSGIAIALAAGFVEELGWTGPCPTAGSLGDNRSGGGWREEGKSIERIGRTAGGTGARA